MNKKAPHPFERYGAFFDFGRFYCGETVALNTSSAKYTLKVTSIVSTSAVPTAAQRVPLVHAKAACFSFRCYTRLINDVMTRLLMKSANREPTIGIRMYALMDGPYRSVMTCIFAIAFGVAPMPKPQVPAAMTAAS